MGKFNLDTKVSINALLYILKELGRTDFHKVFKILYFADQKHLVKWGGPITGDTYIAMKNGPVPSAIYDMAKAVKLNSGYNVDVEELKKYLVADGMHLEAIAEPDMDELAESAIECLNESIKENKALSYIKITEKSHGLAWNSADRNDQISFIHMAKEGGAKKQMLDYIKLVAENIQALNNFGNASTC